MRLSLSELRMLIREAVEKPLTPEEKRDLAKANVFVMDYEADGGVLPPDIEEMTSRQTTPTEARRLLQWAYERAPGTYWL